MACFRPVAAYRTSAGDVVFDSRKADTDLKLPCGACIGCRIVRSRAWSLRCVHEASLNRLNCFVTLTYDREHLPIDGSLHYRDFQLFMKRLRKRAQCKVRFFVCGEYGEKLSRPHYHACLFGYDFPDKRPISLLGADSGWRSDLLTSLWAKGFCHLGVLNVRSAGYAARYCLKKISGKPEHYRRVDSDGVVHDLVPEFAHMSLRPGVGHDWFWKFQDDVLGGDFVVHEGRKYAVPKYYDRLLDSVDSERLLLVKEERAARALPYAYDSTFKRLEVREAVEAARAATLERRLESDSLSGSRA